MPGLDGYACTVRSTASRIEHWSEDLGSLIVVVIDLVKTSDRRFLGLE